eukprot:gnl/Trimastix_PCT/4058.p1 GENE.gnl/Trimastix_PCT/4058~~gnl/Trimastix_PCT/4058.p1  ORF type:complete len:433 (-),score=61.81 gnl/Trimastix_PCT/4058:2297-3595(-)
MYFTLRSVCHRWNEITLYWSTMDISELSMANMMVPRILGRLQNLISVRLATQNSRISLNNELLYTAIFQQTHLEYLDLSDARNAGPMLKACAQEGKKLPTLKILTMARCPITGDEFGYLGECFPNLTSLDLRNLATVDNPALEKLATSLPSLERLNLRCCNRITDDGLQHLAAHCPCLTDLNLRSCARVTNRGIAALTAKLPELRRLNLRLCDRVRPPVLQYMTGLTRLESFTLSHKSLNTVRTLTPAHLTHITAQAHLTSLALCHVTSDALHLICTSFPQLSKLVLKHSPLDDEAIQHLSRLHRLTTLELSGCRHVTDRAMHFLAEQEHSSLTQLKVPRCPLITCSGVHVVLANMQGHLERLVVTECGISEEELSVFQKRFPSVELTVAEHKESKHWNRHQNERGLVGVGPMALAARQGHHAYHHHRRVRP